jgi:hypothetical protein
MLIETDPRSVSRLDALGMILHGGGGYAATHANPFQTHPMPAPNPVVGGSALPAGTAGGGAALVVLPMTAGTGAARKGPCDVQCAILVPPASK